MSEIKDVWISVDVQLPRKPEYDWVLVKAWDSQLEFNTVPHIAELSNDGNWYDTEGNNISDYLKITHWKPIPDEFIKTTYYETNDDYLRGMKDFAILLKDKLKNSVITFDCTNNTPLVAENGIWKDVIEDILNTVTSIEK